MQNQLFLEGQERSHSRFMYLLLGGGVSMSSAATCATTFGKLTRDPYRHLRFSAGELNHPYRGNFSRLGVDYSQWRQRGVQR